MTAIWEGQRALQLANWDESALVLQDTDLFSTCGYWWNMRKRIGENPHGRRQWPDTPDDFPPAQLWEDARVYASDLYIITPSVIPFEPDPLRYGGDHREIEDEVWIDLASGQKLNYIVLPKEPEDWVGYATHLVEEALEKKAELIAYDRHGF